MKLMNVTKKTVDGVDYYLKPFGAFTAANISGKIASLLAPVLGSLAPAFDRAKEDDGADASVNVMDLEVSDAIPAFADALSKLDGEQFEELMKVLLIKHKNVSFEDPETGSVSILTEDLANEVFCGDLQNMLILGFEVVKLNYKGFFGKLGSQFGDLRDLAAKMTPAS